MNGGVEREGRYPFVRLTLLVVRVVHMSSGWSALVLCLILGPRKGYGKSAYATA